MRGMIWIQDTFLEKQIYQLEIYKMWSQDPSQQELTTLTDKKMTIDMNQSQSVVT